MVAIKPIRQCSARLMQSLAITSNTKATTEMSIKLNESTIVYPAKDTPKGSLWLSSLDLITRSPYTHTRLLFVYPLTEPQSSHNLSPKFLDATVLKESLSKALVSFYPMAGRLKKDEKNGRIEIDCNAKGALFIEAETTHELADFGDFQPTDELRKVVFPRQDYSGGLSSFPLLMVQITRFKCGGVCLGFVHHHQVADGASCAQFINSWARVARGLDHSVVEPFLNRFSVLGPRDPPQVKFQHVEYEPPFPALPPEVVLSGVFPSITEGNFKLSKEQINTLKLQAISQDKNYSKLSTFAVLAAHVWRTACKARALADDQDIKLYIPVDGRQRLKDIGFPQNYYGNVIFFTACVTKSRDITRKPLWYAANMVHKTVKKMSNLEYLRSAIDYIESQSDLSALTRGPHTFTCPNFTINSWANIPFTKSDFGWGEPMFFRHGGIQYEGQSYIIASPIGDGSFSVAIKLFTDHMVLFEKYLYEFSSPLLTRL